jgi:Family of unknown function (DUF6941)
MTTENSGPYLNAAVICEKVLQEKDETLSIIRMIDRFNVTVSALGSPENLPPIPLNLAVLISLKSGKAKGRSTVKLRIEMHSGLKLPDQLLPVLFEGEDRGVNLILNLNLVIDQEGVYWFDVLLEEQLLTRIPLRTVYQRIGTSS